MAWGKTYMFDCNDIPSALVNCLVHHSKTSASQLLEHLVLIGSTLRGHFRCRSWIVGEQEKGSQRRCKVKGRGEASMVVKGLVLDLLVLMASQQRLARTSAAQSKQRSSFQWRSVRWRFWQLILQKMRMGGKDEAGDNGEKRSFYKAKAIADI